MKKLMMALLALVMVHVVVAEEAKKAPDAEAIKAGDKEALTTAVDKDVKVYGVISSAAWIPSGSVFLIKFKDAEASQFQGVIFKKDKKAMETAFKGDLSAALNGATIQISGKVKLYREHPEIIVAEAAQITTLEKGTGQASPAAASGPRIFGVYSKLTLTDEQKQKIAAIQKEAYEAERAMEQKLAKESDAKIEPLLTEDQKKQLATLKEEAKSRSRDSD